MKGIPSGRSILCRSLISLAALPLLSSCTGAQDSLSDRKAAAIIEAEFNRSDVGLTLGQVRFCQARTDLTEGRDDLQSELPLYRAFAAKGLITIEDERDLSSWSTGRRDSYKLCGSGGTHVATILLTDQGSAAGTVERRGDFEVLMLQVASYRVEDIVANDPVTVNTDRYRVLQGTHTFEIPEDLRDAWEESRGGSTVKERRFKALLKWDPFDKTWKLAAVDIGKRTEDFLTDNVGRILR